ncbi:hypothetical protein [Polluticaenibacter yanchengensis]|uniref:Benenodin family lasso peptide n=1 Tax=Polluticaenibacter yanchengensis TaxID=3014562 RepID=A0ABT4UKE1_9BACT|nr:hypothetical protein [Chitinophagaceae bacterium LY-5]
MYKKLNSITNAEGQPDMQGGEERASAIAPSDSEPGIAGTNAWCGR